MKIKYKITHKLFLYIKILNIRWLFVFKILTKSKKLRNYFAVKNLCDLQFL